MRFVANGPSIPDNLLVARDAGQVLFFCGAGVSRAEAGLPDFAALTDNVLQVLGSGGDSEARTLLRSARAAEKTSGVRGLLAYDRVFGLLEREFELADIREAVATALRPAPNLTLGPHRALLDLSQTRSSPPRLVTTNFDRLFEECNSSIPSFTPPHLPDPQRENDFQGIIHLHGRVDEQYKHADGDEFVLSSAEFGHAYLSDGWATRYILALLQRFAIVFVGYAADDPPVQYLLEALNRFKRPAHPLFAFHSGDELRAKQQWAHRGVMPLTFDSADNYSGLWNTLSAWAERAKDTDGWYRRVIESGQAGPAQLSKHERGMVAHLAATKTGAEVLATSPLTLPAEWLSVFDRTARYALPGLHWHSETHDKNDPFDEYGIDSDAQPEPRNTNNRLEARHVPSEAWDAFLTTVEDRDNLPASAVTAIRSSHLQSSTLPSRLGHLGWWLCRTAHQPAALWWAAGQQSLHPSIQRDIERSLVNNSDLYSPSLRQGWRILLRCWRQPEVNPDSDRYTVERAASIDGWSKVTVGLAMSIYNPRLVASRPFNSAAPDVNQNCAVAELIRVSVEYPRPHEPFKFPPNMLARAVAALRETIRQAVDLEAEVNGHDRLHLDSVSNAEGHVLDANYNGLTGHMRLFATMLLDLATIDVSASRNELQQWPRDNAVFERLLIWAAGCEELTTPDEAATILSTVADDTFWLGSCETDLLISLKTRWNDLPERAICTLEARLVDGPFPYAEERSDHDEIAAYYRLNRIRWLADRGVAFRFDTESVIASLRAIATGWTEEALDFVGHPSVGEATSVVVDNDSVALDSLPIDQVLAAAETKRKFRIRSAVMYRPFRGLSAKRPARALSVLTHESRHQRFVAWAWVELLDGSSSVNVSSRFLMVVAGRIARLSPQELMEIQHPVSEWLSTNSERLWAHRPQAFELVWAAMLRSLTETASVNTTYAEDHDWVGKALNSVAGQLVQTWFGHPDYKGSSSSLGIRDIWLDRISDLLKLPTEHQIHVIVLVAARLNWLFHVGPVWTKDRLLPYSEGDSAEYHAFWAGYLWTSKIPQLELYPLLKPHFLRLAARQDLRRGEATALAAMVLAGWGRNRRNSALQEVTDHELREVLIHAHDELRTMVLIHLKRWAQDQTSPFADLVLNFLDSVWPRQKSVRTEQMSERLVELCLALPKRLDEFAPLVIPRVVRLRTQSMALYHSAEVDEAILTHPKELCDLLSTVLSENANNWPYGTRDVLTKLFEQPRMSGDMNLSRLMEIANRFHMQ
jgi:hypothetical protein